jgi:hypothetical protein
MKRTRYWKSIDKHPIKTYAGRQTLTNSVHIVKVIYSVIIIMNIPTKIPTRIPELAMLSIVSVSISVAVAVSVSVSVSVSVPVPVIVIVISEVQISQVFR